MKVHCRYCDTPSREIDYHWWCPTCGSVGEMCDDGSVEWTTPTAPAMEYDGTELIAGTRRFKLVEVT